MLLKHLALQHPLAFPNRKFAQQACPFRPKDNSIRRSNLARNFKYPGLPVTRSQRDLRPAEPQLGERLRFVARLAGLHEAPTRKGRKDRQNQTKPLTKPGKLFWHGNGEAG